MFKLDLGTDLAVSAIKPSLSTVYYFKNREHTNIDNPHYHIAIPTKNGGFVLLVMFTSQIEGKQEHYGLVNPRALNSLVFANSSQCNFLTKDSVIDCNQPIYKSREELGAIIFDIEYRQATLSDDFIKEIKRTINESPIVRPHIKNAIV